MAAAQRRYNKAEFARRGDALVASKVRPHLTEADEDKFVAIDIETGEYELDKNEMKAAARLRKRVSNPLEGSPIILLHYTSAPTPFFIMTWRSLREYRPHRVG
jgi:hypothetical protein